MTSVLQQKLFGNYMREEAGVAVNTTTTSTLYSSEIRILCLKVCILLEYENAKFFFFHSIFPRHKMFQKYRRNIALGHFIKYITQFKTETMT